MTRLVLDVSSLIGWSGPPVGISRVEHALAMRALRRSDTVLAVYDGVSGCFRELDPVWQETVIGWNGMIESPDQPSGRRAWRPSRKRLVARLETLRLTLRLPVLARLADVAQRAILAVRRHNTPLFDAAGLRIARLPPDIALGAPLRLGPGDVLFAAGSGWSHLDMAVIAALRRRDGFRFATLCYDLIPITHPQFWAYETIRLMQAHWLATLAVADLVVANAHCIARDIDDFSRGHGLTTPATIVLPLGFDPIVPGASATLPAGLIPGRYALFVSTIEPRKGHAMLLLAWRRLLGRGIPQRHGFRLVFVGRPGWMVEDVLRTLADPTLAGSVLHLSGIGDAQLDALYEAAAFGLYPSVYEGFGLPLIEAFARGKAVLASTGGAVPETVGDLSPCLPPGDVAAWEAVLGAWITEPAARQPWETRIREKFVHPDWDHAAGALLDAVARSGSQPQGPQA